MFIDSINYIKHLFDFTFMFVLRWKFFAINLTHYLDLAVFLKFLRFYLFAILDLFSLCLTYIDGLVAGRPSLGRSGCHGIRNLS